MRAVSTDRPDEELPAVRPRWSLDLGGLVIANEGSTARDGFAHERNYLAMAKLSLSLFVISAALLLRFHFGASVAVPPFEMAAGEPLGVLFGLAAVAILATGTITYFSDLSQMQRQVGFIALSFWTQGVMVGVGALTAATCVLLLVGEQPGKGGHGI